MISPEASISTRSRGRSVRLGRRRVGLRRSHHHSASAAMISTISPTTRMVGPTGPPAWEGPTGSCRLPLPDSDRSNEARVPVASPPVAGSAAWAVASSSPNRPGTVVLAPYKVSPSNTMNVPPATDLARQQRRQLVRRHSCRQRVRREDGQVGISRDGRLHPGGVDRERIRRWIDVDRAGFQGLRHRTDRRRRCGRPGQQPGRGDEGDQRRQKAPQGSAASHVGSVTTPRPVTPDSSRSSCAGAVVSAPSPWVLRVPW